MDGSILPKTLLLAEDESRRARCYFVGTEHLFLAVARQASPEVQQILVRNGISLSQAVSRVQQLLGYWEPDENWSGLLLHTPRLRQIARRAVYLAEREAGREPQPWHYLTALLEDESGHTVRAIRNRVSAPPGPSPQASNETTASAAPPTETPPAEMDITFEPASEKQKRGAAAHGRRTALSAFGRDLTALAEAGELPPFVGGQREIQMLVRTLTRQTKPNPLIVGEPGTGKTALVEGLAQHLVGGKVPPALAGSRVVELSLGSLVAGTQYRGEFEQRIEAILNEVAARPEVILFLDEFHQAVGAGAVGSGSMDAANVLKPALARGTLRCIGATTLREYRKYIEPDAALLRRFQVIMLNQPDEQKTLEILRGLRQRLEAHHGVTIRDEALSAAIRLAHRYESDRQQPDKSIDLVDDACTRVALEAAEQSGERRDPPAVTAEHVARAISDRTGIPVAQLTADEMTRLAGLEKALAREIRGQEEAIHTVAATLRETRLALREDDRPQAVFLFAGPTGVGKTALAQALARECFGLDEALLRIDLSEYMEPHSVSRLIGAPPGYVGHDEQGQLTRALRVRPHSLVLLDEVEKAHPRVCDVFLQVFGSGRLTDGRGEVVDCRQALFVMTTNLGAEAYDEGAGFGFQPAAKEEKEKTAERVEAVREACQKHFRPELLNRVDRIVCFNSLGPAVLRIVLDQLIEETIAHLRARGVEMEVDGEARDAMVQQAGTRLGVPPLKRLLREQILNPVAQLMVAAPTGEPLRVMAMLQDGRIEVRQAKD